MPRKDDPEDFLPEAEQPRGGRPRLKLFRGDEMSSGQSSSLLKRVRKVIGSQKPAAGAAAQTNPVPPSEDPTRQEIKRRAMAAELAAAQATKPGAKPAARAKGGDTFIRRKMKQAEKNLPVWDPSDDDTVS